MPLVTHDFLQLVGRLALAALLGGAIGMEREFSHKAAGLRTNILIALGSALFTILSFEISPAAAADRSRVASGIVTGVGFLGGGAILRTGSRVQGLTTAATIWVVAGIGMSAAVGSYGVALASTVVSLFVLRVMPALENWLHRQVGGGGDDPSHPPL